MLDKPVITVEELRGLRNDNDVVIVDCRFDLNDPEAGLHAFRKGPIPGEIIAGKTGRHPLPDASVLYEKAIAWGVSQETQVIVYDQGIGAFAGRLWWLLHWLGQGRVAILDGGWKAWLEKDYEVSSSVPQPLPGKPWQVVLRQDLVASAEEIEQIIKAEDGVIVDSREPARYSGQAEPIDPVAGHIPGARNLHFAENMRHYGYWKDESELRELYLAAGLMPEDEVIVYCGSGITACHNIIGFIRAGLPMPRLYPGSWSEWITDPQRGVATGPRP